MKRGALLLLILIVLSPAALSIGLRGADLKLELDFEPYLEKVIEYTIVTNSGSTMDYYVETTGSLSEYVTLSQTVFEDVPSGTLPKFTADLKLPSKVNNPGINTIYIKASEGSNRGGGDGALGIKTSTVAMILIDVPFPDKFAVMTLSAKSVNLNAPIVANVFVDNKGEKNLDAVYAKLMLYDKDGILVKEMTTDAVGIPTKETHTFPVTLYTEGLKPGKYRLSAEVNYDGNIMEENLDIKIGDLVVLINDFTEEFEADKINRFDINVESMWNNLIEVVYVEVDIDGDKIVTPTQSLQPWQNSTFTTYWDTTGIVPGTYEARITVHYADKITERLVYLNVLESDSSLSMKFLSKENLGISPVYLAILVVLIIIIADLIFILKKKKGG